MSGSERQGQHLENWELIALLRGDEADGGEPARAHVASCERCARRLQLLGARLDRVSAAVGELDYDTPGDVRPPRDEARASASSAGAAPARSDRQRAGGWPWVRLAQAAVLVLVAGSLLAVQPVRARVADWLATAWAGLDGRAGAAAPAAPEPVTPEVGAAELPAIRFEPAGERLLLELDGSPAGGGIVLRRSAGRQVVLRIRGASPDMTPVIGPSSIRVGNTAATTAHYEIDVPASVRAVELRTGDGVPRTVRLPAEAGAERVLALGGAR